MALKKQTKNVTNCSTNLYEFYIANTHVQINLSILYVDLEKTQTQVLIGQPFNFYILRFF